MTEVRRMGRGAIAAIALAAALGACDRGGAKAPEQREAAARQDSTKATAKELEEQGVSVDTQRVDSGTVSASSSQDN